MPLDLPSVPSVPSTLCLPEYLNRLPGLLQELGGVPMPPNETYDGVSLVPLVDGTAKSTGKNMSFSQYARGFAARETPPPYPPTNLSDLWCEKRTYFALFAVLY